MVFGGIQIADHKVLVNFKPQALRRSLTVKAKERSKSSISHKVWS